MLSLPMPTRDRFFNGPADFIVAIAVLLILGLLVLWVRSPRRGGDELVLNAPRARLHVLSRDGRIILGLMWPDRYAARGTRREMRELINDEERWGFLSFVGWGVAAPHGVLIAVLAIVPAWWWVVHRGRLEEDRRRTSGLCRACGYDLRVATTRCPECGTDIGVAGLGRIVRPIEAVARFDAAGGDEAPSTSATA
jgi:hypothetical protein